MSTSIERPRGSNEPMGATMRLQSLIPVLDVCDVDTSIEFYCDILGFSMEDKVEWGGKTEWALLRTDKVQLMLCASQTSPDAETGPDGDGVFFVYLDNVEAMHVYLGSKGYTTLPSVPHPAAAKKEFYIRDPDGYVLWFSHRSLKAGRTAAVASLEMQQ